MQKGLFVLALLLSTSKSFAQSPATGTINGYEYVDLGLSVKWATCNIGASQPSDYGDYFAWGETAPKSNYDEDNCTTCGKDMGDISGNVKYDAARANWGSTWRMPTLAEFDEMHDKCTQKKTTINGHNGTLVTGPNGNTIFFPAAGNMFYDSHYSVESDIGTECWTSTPDDIYDGNSFAISVGLLSDEVYMVGHNSRADGYNIRPVSK